jgi:alpha 1,2-mannosyltransferase
MGLKTKRRCVSVCLIAAIVSAVAFVDLIFSNLYIPKHVQPVPYPCGPDAECADFHQLLNERWPPEKPRGVVVLLIGRRTVSSRGAGFRSFAENFDKNFNNAFDYPVIIFHQPEDVDEAVKQNLRSLTRSKLYFQRVDFRLPSFINESHISKHCFGLQRFGFGYRHMCRFHAKEIYGEPILATDRLQYIWRLDDDSILTKPNKYDIFRYMRDHRLRYGYALIANDHSDCIYGLENAVRDYCKHNNVTPSFVWTMPRIVYNNFEVSEMSFWRSAGYRQSINFFDSTGGAPIKSLAVSLLLRKDEVHRFNDIGYSHKSSSY